MQDFRELATNSLRYWEKRRFVYNGVLVVIVVSWFVAQWPASRASASFGNGAVVLFLGLIANALYCFVYLPDVFVQLSEFRSQWRRWRWLLLVVVTAIAGSIANLWASITFRPIVD